MTEDGEGWIVVLLLRQPRFKHNTFEESDINHVRLLRRYDHEDVTSGLATLRPP
jgi:hypothetical protein